MTLETFVGENDVSVQDLSKFEVSTDLRGRPGYVLVLWWFVQGTLFALSPQFMYGWRRWLLRCFGCDVGALTAVRASVKIQYPWKVKIGRRAQIGDRVELSSTGPITIGDDVVISQQAFLCAGTHDISEDRFETLGPSIIVDDQVWICAGAFIHPNSRVGRGAIIAARSVFRGTAEPYKIYSGFPAAIIGDRRDKLRPPARP